MKRPYVRRTADTTTRGLSLEERGAYEVLMDHYFTTQAALPSLPATVHRIAGATNDMERASVDRVIQRLFTAQDDGLIHSKKADDAIAKYLVCIAKKAEGGRNGAAKWSQMRAEQQAAYLAGYPQRHAAEAGTRIYRKTGKHAKPLDPTRKAESAKRRAAVEISLRMIDYLNERAGTRYEGTRAHVVLMTSRILQDGADEAKMRAVIDMKVAEWGKDLERRRYLSPDTLFNATKWGKYVGQIEQRDVQAQAQAERALQHYVMVVSYSEGDPLAKGVAAQQMVEEIDPLAIAKRAMLKFGDVVRQRNAIEIAVIVDEKERARYKVEELVA